jgi:hypothetical protein
MLVSNAFVRNYEGNNKRTSLKNAIIFEADMMKLLVRSRYKTKIDSFDCDDLINKCVG